MRCIARSLTVLATLVVASAILSACDNAPASHSMKTGSVEGRLMISPPMGPTVPTSGTVTLAEQGSPHSSVTVEVGASGRFRAQVPAGTWVVTGQSPMYGNGQYVCRSTSSAVVVANHLVSVSVWCIEK